MDKDVSKHIDNANDTIEVQVLEVRKTKGCQLKDQSKDQYEMVKDWRKRNRDHYNELQRKYRANDKKAREVGKMILKFFSDENGELNEAALKNFICTLDETFTKKREN